MRATLTTLFLGALLLPALAEAGANVINVLETGAVGDGLTLDTAAFQKAIDCAAAWKGGGQVFVPGGHRYLVGTLELRSGIDFHLAGDAELLASTNAAHYTGDALIRALNANDLRITGTGKINGQAEAFMTGYDSKGEWWVPAAWRPKLFNLTGCQRLVVRDITFGAAPYWGLHLLGCQHVQVDHVTVRNRMDVPNCDGIDPDHCQDVLISRCELTCGDDAIVVKTTAQTNNFGPSAHILVRDCVMETQDSGIKIGTETTQDIHDVRVERCRIRGASRGLAIQLRDEGNVYNINFRDIQLVARFFAEPWWGRGEAISFTAMPRTPETRLGSLHHVRVQNVTGRAENSIRVCGTPVSRIHDVQFDKVALTFERWTPYPGGVFDNRPTKVLPEIEPHGTPGFSLRHADRIRLKHCQVTWGANIPEYFTFAIEAEDVTGLKLTSFSGQAAHPQRDLAIHRWFN